MTPKGCLHSFTMTMRTLKVLLHDRYNTDVFFKHRTLWLSSVDYFHHFDNMCCHRIQENWKLNTLHKLPSCYLTVFIKKMRCWKMKSLTFCFSNSSSLLLHSLCAVNSSMCLFLVQSSSIIPWRSDRSFRFSPTTLCVFCWESCRIFRISSDSEIQNICQYNVALHLYN